MVAITTTGIYTEVVPNPGQKEIIVETPVLTRGGSDNVQITLADHGIAPEGPTSIRGFLMSATYGIITTNDPVTSIIDGTMIISSTAAITYPAKQIYRITGTSS